MLVVANRADHDTFKMNREHILGSDLNNAWTARMRECEQCSKVEIVSEDDVSVLSSPRHDDVVRGARVADP